MLCISRTQFCRGNNTASRGQNDDFYRARKLVKREIIELPQKNPQTEMGSTWLIKVI